MKNSNFKLQLTTLFLMVISWGFSQSLPDFFVKSDTFFKTYVQNGKVAYKSIKNDDTTLKELMQQMEVVEVSISDANTYKSFWINAYNLTIINGVVSKYPVKSPLDIAGFFDKNKHSIAGKKLTVNNVENKNNY